MRSSKKWAVLVAVGAAALFVLHRMEGCEPEDDLADHLDELTSLMKRHVGSPRVGVAKVFDYNRDHVAGMMQDWGEIMAALDSLEKPGPRERRGQRIVRKLKPSLGRLKAAAEPFFDAVGRDPEAQKLMEERLARLKPLEDLFGALGGPAPWSRALPVPIR